MKVWLRFQDDLAVRCDAVVASILKIEKYEKKNYFLIESGAWMGCQRES